MLWNYRSHIFKYRNVSLTFTRDCSKRQQIFKYFFLHDITTFPSCNVTLANHLFFFKFHNLNMEYAIKIWCSLIKREKIG